MFHSSAMDRIAVRILEATQKNELNVGLIPIFDLLTPQLTSCLVPVPGGNPIPEAVWDMVSLTSLKVPPSFFLVFTMLR